MKSTEANSSHLKKRNSSFDMTKKDKKKLRAQVKSRFYYYFWAFMDLSQYSLDNFMLDMDTVLCTEVCLI